eukprot:SAG31_NODE_2166_length_6280_cov_4.776250_5_plen_115_part_00
MRLSLLRKIEQHGRDGKDSSREQHSEAAARKKLNASVAKVLPYDLHGQRTSLSGCYVPEIYHLTLIVNLWWFIVVLLQQRAFRRNVQHDNIRTFVGSGARLIDNLLPSYLIFTL